MARYGAGAMLDPQASRMLTQAVGTAVAQAMEKQKVDDRQDYASRQRKFASAIKKEAVLGRYITSQAGL